MFKSIVKHGLRAIGYEVSKLGRLADTSTMRGGLHRVKGCGLEVKSVIDVGASDGSWSVLCREFYPAAKYLLFEAQQPHLSALESAREKYGNFDFIMKAASDRPGKVYFDDSDLWGGVASHEAISRHYTMVDSTTIDQEVAKHGLTGPFLIKLDTHGHEPAILAGASQTLLKTGLLIIECYNSRINREAVKYDEICHLVGQYGFELADIVDNLYRNNKLWQMDMFFTPMKNN